MSACTPSRINQEGNPKAMGPRNGNYGGGLGDVFGSTVNAASRLTSAARPGSVLVDAGVHEALATDDEDGGPGWRFRRARRISAKGFTNLEAWRVRAPQT